MSRRLEGGKEMIRELERKAGRFITQKEQPPPPPPRCQRDPHKA